VISFEEYHPYGTSAYRAWKTGVEVSAKRYRYNGKERDEETSLSYYGARYYAPWLGRWTAADPAGLVDGPGLYNYCRGSPVTLCDPNGRQGNAGAGGSSSHIPEEEQGARGAGPGRPLETDFTRVGREAEAAAKHAKERLSGGTITLTTITIKIGPPLYDPTEDIRGVTGPSIGEAHRPQPEPELTPEQEVALAGAAGGFVPYAGDYWSALISLGLFADDPNLQTAAELGLDVVGAAAPFVGPLGSLLRLERLEDARDLSRLELPDAPRPRTPEEVAAHEDFLKHSSAGQRAQHHSDPKFLGGDPSQPLTDLPVAGSGGHVELHKELNDFLAKRRKPTGEHMRPQRGNPGSKIQGTFTRQERLEALRDFYKAHADKYPEAAEDFFKQHPGLR
jgi:RHS repeat-associated protein